MGKLKLKNVATAQYDFARLRENGDFVYVDKTDMLAKLAMKDPDAIYFIARPRRFGKSLMLTTLRCMFEGRKELFRGLKIMTPEETFASILRWAEPYRARPITLVGIKFDLKIRNIDIPRIEPL